MLKRAAFVLIFLSTHAFASDKVSDFLTVEIYNVDSIDGMQTKKREAAIKGTLGSLEKEKCQLKEALCEAQKNHVLDLPEKQEPVAHVVGPIIRPIFFAAITGWALGPPGLLIGFGVGVRLEYNTRQLAGLKSALAAVEMRIKGIESALKDENIFPLEMKYFRNKSTFTRAKLNTRIENALIAAYAAAPQADLQFLESLMRFPLKKKGIAQDGDDDAFRENLMQKKEVLRQGGNSQRAEDVLNAIASDNAEDVRSVIYLRTQEGDELASQIETVARILSLPVLVVDANEHPILNDAFCLGAENGEKGLYLSVFMNPDPAQSVLNPVLIVRNADEWMTNPQNLPTMLKMTDREYKSFSSNYFGVDIDMHLLNVVFIGKVDRKSFDHALKSRLNSI